MSAPRANVLIAGGGTGGHVFPGVAVADELVQLADVDVTFCGTARGLESRVIPATAHQLTLLRVEPMKGGGARRAARGAIIAAAAMRSAVALLRRLRPKVVLSVGGYAAGPVALAAELSGIPVALLEPNATAGFTNKVLAPGARRLFTAFETVRGMPWPGKIQRLGTPVRAGYEPAEYTCSAQRLLIVGGSLGASHLNATVPRAVAALKADSRFSQLTVVHQTGRGHETAVEEAYAALGLGAPVVTVVPFLDDPRTYLRDASLVLCRAGAVTVAEIRAIGRPAIFVPFPHAADDHQTANAEAVVREQGGLHLPQHKCSVAALEDALRSLLGDPLRLTSMAHASQVGGRPHAARAIAQELLQLARIPQKRVREAGLEP